MQIQEINLLPEEEAFVRFWPSRGRKFALDGQLSTLIKQGIAEVSDGKFKRAIEIFSLAIQRYPECALAYAWRGEAKLNLKYYQHDVPKKRWEKHRKIYPYRRLFFIGRVPRPDSYPELASDFSRAIELDPSQSWFHSQRGEARYLFVNYSGAMSDFTKTVQINNRHGFAYLWRAEIYYRTQRWDLAVSEAKRGLSLAPHAAWLHAFLARMQDSSGHRNDALCSMERAIALDPSIGWYRAWRGETLRKLGRLDEALDEFAAAISIDPEDSLAYAWRGATLRRQGRSAGAVKELEKAADLDPDYAYTFSELAHAQRQTGQVGAALESMARAHIIDNKYLWAYRNPNLPQDFQQAIADLDVKIRAEPSAEALAWRGKISLEYGSTKDALAAFDKALSLDENYFLAHLWSGQARMQMGESAAAVKNFHSALRINPSSGHAEGWLGRSLAAVERHGEALACFNAAICRDPHNCRSWIYYHRAKAREKLGDFAGALQDVDNHLWISRRDPQAEILRKLLVRHCPEPTGMTLCA